MLISVIGTRLHACFSVVCGSFCSTGAELNSSRGPRGPIKPKRVNLALSRKGVQPSIKDGGGLTCLRVPRRPLWAEAVAKTLSLFCVHCRCEGPLEGRGQLADWMAGSGWSQTATVPGLRAGMSGRKRESLSSMVSREQTLCCPEAGWVFPDWIFGALQMSAVLGGGGFARVLLLG